MIEGTKYSRSIHADASGTGGAYDIVSIVYFSCWLPCRRITEW